VSGEHAVILWDRGWWVRDLGSRNGTFVQGRRLAAGEAVSVAAGAEIGFGAVDEPWVLAEDAGPGPRARGPAGEEVAGSGELLVLPGPQSPEVSVYREGSGRWVVEDALGVHAVKDGAEVLAGGLPFRLALPEAVPGTLRGDAGTVDELTLRFVVSHDEEHVRLGLSGATGERDLGARSHHYLLLTLARARREDATLGTPPETHGWRYQDELAAGLGLEPRLLNLHVYRARQQLAELGVADPARRVERRPAAGQLRIGTDRFELVRQ